MSSRQLRKLRQQQELLNLQKESTGRDADSGSDTDEEPPLISRPAKTKFSGFAALAGEDDEGEGQEEADENENENEPPDAPVHVPEESTPVKKNKKSKKKKKKGKKVESATQPEAPPKADNDLDEIDRAIQELSLEKQVSSPKTTTGPDSVAQASERVSHLLRINFQHLKVLNEMRRLFGKEAMDRAEQEEDAEIIAAHGRRQRQPRPQNVDLETFLRGPPGKGIPEVVRRRNPFIEGKSLWPRGTAGGLTMTSTGDTKGNLVEFTFSHDKNYNRLEAQFFFLVGMHDPNKLILFLHQHPYHVSTLIQVSRIAHQDQNAALAAELCERALFTFGRVTLSTFRKKLEEGKARMSFLRPENRQFWLAGYHYIKNLIRKGTYRTALEWAKLFLSLDHDDPYGMLNWIHVLAIRARESEWFVSLCQSELLEDKPDFENAKYTRQTMVLAQLQLGDRDHAKATLHRGMEEVRWMYTKLFGALDLDVPPSLWGVMAPNQDEYLFTDLYMHLAADLWNNTEAKSLLQEVAMGLSTPGQRGTGDTVSVKPAQVSLSTARFIYLDGKPDLMSGVPRGLLHTTPNFDFDPLPPPRDQNIFSDDTQMLPWTIAREEDDFAPPDIDILVRDLPGAIPATEPDVPEGPRGFVRRILEMLGPGALGPGPVDADRLDMPGAFFPSDDEEEEDAEEEEEEVGDWGEYEEDFEGPDDFGDEFPTDDSLPDLE